MSVKHFVHQFIRRTGWDLNRFDPHASAAAQLVRQLFAHQIDTVIDVGANTGQFAQQLRDAGFPGRIVSFEPAADAHSRLRQRAQGDARWIIAPRMALGDHDGTITLNLAGNSFSSSVLPMLPAHVTAAPEARYTGSETVDLRTLDSASRDLATDTEPIFLKLDVQGFEYQVLQGAERFLGRAAGIQLELSLVPLYAGQHLFHPMLHELEKRGYDLWSLVPAFVDPDTRRLLQLDATFFRKGAEAG